jgi:hypothetical protein
VGPAIITSDEIYHYRLLREGILARLHTTPENLVAATDLLTNLALSRNGILLPVHDRELWKAFQKAGEHWLEELKPVSDQAARQYREHRRRGSIRRAERPSRKSDSDS